MALAGAASNFLVLGIAVFGFGVFITPIREETGWTLTQISIAFSIRSFENGLLAPFTGFMVDRLGARRMAISGLIALTVGLVLFSQSRTIWVFYAASLVMAFGQSLGSYTPFSAALMRWFSRHRGRAMGLVSTGNGAGGLAAPILATMIVLMGWRSTALAAAAAVLVFGLPLAMTLRDRPEPYGTGPDGVPLTQVETGGASARGYVPPTLPGYEVREALRIPAFYLLAFASGLGGGVLVAWIVHAIPHLEETGYSLQAAASIAGAYAVVQVGMRYGLGWAGDVLGRRPMFIASFLLMGLGLLVFNELSPGRWWLVPIYYVTFAPGHAMFAVMGQTVIADYFGTRRFATIRGLAQSTSMPLGIAMPVFAGWIFDRNGNYEAAFWLFAAMSVLAALLLLLVRRPQWSDLPAQVPQPPQPGGAAARS